MKIALVTETFPPEVNGVAMTLSNLVCGLRERGNAVRVVRPRQPSDQPSTLASASEAESNDLLVPGFPIPLYPSLRFGLPTVWRLEEFFRTWRPNVIHIATEGPLGLAALVAANRARRPVASSFHTNFHTYSGNYGAAALRDATLAYLRWFHNRTRRTLVPTRQMTHELAAAGFHGLGVLGRGVDTRLFSPARRNPALRASWGAAPEDPVAIYVGRLAAEKNLGLVVKAFLTLRQRAPTARLVLVGDGPERPALARAHPEFHYAGMRRGEELAAHYASADVFLFASTSETFGNVIPEAMASGLVTVSYNYAAAREHLRDGENGFAAEFDVPEAFLAAVARMWAAQPRWAQIRTRARATAEKLTWAAVVEAFERDLRAVAGF